MNNGLSSKLSLNIPDLEKFFLQDFYKSHNQLLFRFIMCEKNI